MGKIADLSKYQQAIDWSQTARELDLAILRVQFGSTTVDQRYKEYVAGCKQYGIPFGSYAFGMFVSESDAIQEAKDFLSRIDPATKFLVLDVEGETISSCGVASVAKASQAFINTCKQAGYKTGFYVSHNLYKQYGLDTVQADFLWLPRYGANDGSYNMDPNYPCDLHQFTSTGRLAGVQGNVDLNRLTGSKPLAYFTGGGGETMQKNANQFLVNGVPVEYQMIDGSTHLHWKCLDILGLKYNYNIYKDQGVTCFNVEGKSIDAPIVDGDSYLPWNLIPGLQVKGDSPANFEFYTVKPEPQVMVMTKPPQPTTEPVQEPKQDDIDKLVAAGFINTPEYWKQLLAGEEQFNPEYFKTLIGRVANKL